MSLLTFESDVEIPTVADAARILNTISCFPVDLDESYAPVLIDPKKNLYCVRTNSEGHEGEFSDPVIDTFE